MAAGFGPNFYPNGCRLLLPAEYNILTAEPLVSGDAGVVRPQRRRGHRGADHRLVNLAVGKRWPLILAFPRERLLYLQDGATHHVTIHATRNIKPDVAVPSLIRAIQQQQELIAALTARLATLGSATSAGDRNSWSCD